MAELTYLQAISDALDIEMKRDDSVYILGEDVAEFGGAFKLTKGLHEKYPGRVLNTPISETAILGAAIGSAINGMRPVAEMQFMDFVTNGFNQLANVASTTSYRWGIGVPMVVRGPSGGGTSGGPFHSRNSEAWFAHTPGLKVVCPAFPDDAKGLLASAIRDDNPVMYFEHKALYRSIKGEVPEGEYTVPFGEVRIVREGTDLSIITYGSMVHKSLKAAEVLAEKNIHVEVVDIRTLVPFDEEGVLRSVRKTNRALIVHEATSHAGFGGEIAARIADKAFDALDAPVKRVAALDAPTPFAKTMEEFVLPQVDDVVQAAEAVVSY